MCALCKVNTINQSKKSADLWLTRDSINASSNTLDKIQQKKKRKTLENLYLITNNKSIQNYISNKFRIIFSV